MQFGKKQQLMLIALFAAMIVTFFYLTNNTKNSAQEAVSQVGSEPSDTLPETAIASSPEPQAISGADPDSPTSYAKRIKAGKYSEKPSRIIESRTDIDWENQLVAQTVLESALADNVDDTIAVSELIRQCGRRFDNERQIKRELDRVALSIAEGNPVQSTFLSGTGEPFKFGKLSDYEEFMWTRFAQCNSTRSMFDRGLRDRLDRLAESGNVSARYLYAMWPPNQEKTARNQLIAWLEYTSKAMDFTWKNISEREPLGLLAFGQSLEAPTALYFTVRNPVYGQAFILAAEKCGLNNQMVMKKASNMEESWKQPRMAEYFTQMQSWTDEIVEMFCY